MLIRTPSLVYDDRVRKEVNTLQSNNSVIISAFENKQIPLTTEYKNERVVVLRNELKFRKIFPSGRFASLKLFEMYYRFICDYRKFKPDALWLHNFESVGIVILFGVLKKLKFFRGQLIWDQHELPPNAFVKSPILKSIYKLTLKLTDKNIHACDERAIYINNKLKLNKHYEIIENFPDQLFIKFKGSPINKEVEAWLNGEVFLLCQGGARSDRGFKEVVEAAITSSIKVVFIGPFDPKEVGKYKSLYSSFDKWVHMHASVPQLELTSYIRLSSASLVFYKKEHMNNWLCAPNRFYQALSLGKPVISGNNPLFATYKVTEGVFVCDTDGNDTNEIVKGITRFLNDDLTTISNKCYWESQEGKILNVVSAK